MQQLLSNFDLNDENDVPVMAAVPTVYCDLDSTELDLSDQPLSDSGFFMENPNRDQSLETTLDNEDEPLDLTADDDSEDAADGASSDEQQQSRSLSLSYSLSVSHAQENVSQYSQSTDKGLSKRYDSPCSYEDDRESECTNFDKLDDWSDFITDMQNNNNGDTNRDFREYYDEYLVAKCLKGSDDGADPADECCVKAKVDSSLETTSLEKDKMQNYLEKDQCDRSTPSESMNESAMNKSASFWEYRSPPADNEDDPMVTGSNPCTGTAEPVQRVQSFKRKFHYDDLDDIEYEVTKVITEKFRKTDVVPFHGCHDPISSIDDELFARMVLIDCSSKTPIPGESNNAEIPVYNKIFNDSYVVECDSSIATTPTNVRNLDQVFQTFDNATDSAVEMVDIKKPLQKVLSQNAINSGTSIFKHFDWPETLKPSKSE